MNRMNDLISRQAALDALAEWHDVAITNRLNNLPSAQPEPSQVARDIATIIENEQDMRVIARNDIVRCKDCKHNPKDEWFGCPMSHLNEKQRPETAWCWKGERKDDDNG